MGNFQWFKFLKTKIIWIKNLLVIFTIEYQLLDIFEFEISKINPFTIQYNYCTLFAIYTDSYALAHYYNNQCHYCYICLFSLRVRKERDVVLRKYKALKEANKPF